MNREDSLPRGLRILAYLLGYPDCTMRAQLPLVRAAIEDGVNGRR